MRSINDVHVCEGGVLRITQALERLWSDGASPDLHVTALTLSLIPTLTLQPYPNPIP